MCTELRKMGGRGIAVGFSASLVLAVFVAGGCRDAGLAEGGAKEPLAGEEMREARASAGAASSRVGDEETSRGQDADIRLDRIDDRSFSVLLGDEPIFVMESGYLARFRGSVEDDPWLGTRWHPVHLGWSPNHHPEVVVESVEADLRGQDFEIRVRGRKAQWEGARFQTRIAAVARSPVKASTASPPSWDYRLQSSIAFHGGRSCDL